MNPFITISLFIFTLFFWINPVNAGDRMKGPPQQSPVLFSEDFYGSGRNAFVDVYQRYISPVKGGNLCPMFPSCSQYAKIALKHYDFLYAYPMLFERILRCGHELYLYPLDTVNNTLKWYDPVFP
jgi:putative component of membrane protein insertase Oxa1/YidC/SpoIIIJ protein YidD